MKIALALPFLLPAAVLLFLRRPIPINLESIFQGQTPHATRSRNTDFGSQFLSPIHLVNVAAGIQFVRHHTAIIRDVLCYCQLRAVVAILSMYLGGGNVSPRTIARLASSTYVYTACGAAQCHWGCWWFWCKALVVRRWSCMGILVGLAVVFYTTLIPLDVGNICTFCSIFSLWVIVYPWYGNRDSYCCCSWSVM